MTVVFDCKECSFVGICIRWRAGYSLSPDHHYCEVSLKFGCFFFLAMGAAFTPTHPLDYHLSVQACRLA